MRGKQWVVLILVLVVGIFLRFYKLGETPKGFYLDEAAIGYNAYSIMKTGKDEYGKFLPVLFRSFTDFKAPIYIYLLIPIYKIFGVTMWSTRLLSAIAGIVVIWFGFWLVKNLSKSFNLAVITALLLAISPWQIIFSRTSYETNLSLAWMMIMLWSFFKFRENRKWLIVTAVTSALAFLSYHSERVIIPLLLLGLAVKYQKEIFIKNNRKILIASIIVGLVLVLPTVKLMATPGFLSRLNSLSIFSETVKKPWDFNQDLTGWKSLIFNNRMVLETREFLSLYVSYFSPRYLFELGDPGPRSSYPDLAPFFWWQLPFWLIGWGWLIKKTKEKDFKFLVGLMLLVTPIPASITRDPFSSIRALPLVLPMIILTAKGVEIFRGKFDWWAKIILIFLMVWSLGKIYLSVFKFNDYFRGYAWDEGTEELVDKLKEITEPVVMDNSRGEIYSQILFFTKTDPDGYQQNNFEVTEGDYYTEMGRNKDKQIGNIAIRQINWEEDIYKEQILVGDNLAIGEEQISEHCLTVVFEIKDREGKVIFRGVKTHPEDKKDFDKNKLKTCVVTKP